MGVVLTVLSAVGTSPVWAQESSEPTPAPSEDHDSPTVQATQVPLTLADRFAGTSILVEHAFTFLHHLNLSPQYTRSLDRIVKFSPSFRATRSLTLDVDLAIARALTVTDTTYPMEILLGDIGAGASLTLPVPKPLATGLAVSTGLSVEGPTSKASQAESLILALTPWFEFGVTAPLLDGLTLAYRLSPTPRFQRYTTSQLLVPRPCSPAVGCTLGATTNTGQRNTALQLGNEISLALALAKERLGISGSFALTHGFLHPKSPSDRWEESTLTVPGNGGGSPVTLSTEFIFDISYQLHPGLGLSVGLWTLGGMTPDGSWYNPVANRWSQIYIDVTFSPVAMVEAEVQRARRSRVANKRVEEQAPQEASGSPSL
ncbi:MAG TPA: hypothetical protein DIU15_02565 [Deltaproteobacteria bacterium]|nr:hypothetical protein [Deltaproteobacteria bacterium]HCP44898.1 hypothetical protein [Deltaproteobacteria bacterium]